MSKKINRALIQDILSKGDGVKSVAAEAVDWVISVAEQAAKQLAESGRRTPSGRLMAPRMDAGLMVRHLTKAPDEIAGVALAETPSVQDVARSEGAWSEYNDWQTAVKRGESRLPFEEWLEARKKLEYVETQAKERHGK